MRLLAIGDIHGRLRALQALLDTVGPTPGDRIVTLGDYVDGGPNARGVLDLLIVLSTSTNLVAIRGNHDQLMREARAGEFELELWKSLGGDQTLASYPGESMSGVPDEHWRFLDATCVDFFENQSHIFVHAHVEPDLRLNQQRQRTLHWRALSMAVPHMSGKTVICGHTPQTSGYPVNLGHTICLDTADWLTCLDLSSNEYWQANNEGETRQLLVE